MDPHHRASDADRERTVTALRMHVADGRITVEEFSDRSADAYTARTLGDLATITADLPPVDHDTWATEPASRRTRPAWLVAGLAAATAIGFSTLGALTHAAAAAGPMMGGVCH
jgi:Domain of unknown function (DUF1707)